MTTKVVSMMGTAAMAAAALLTDPLQSSHTTRAYGRRGQHQKPGPTKESTRCAKRRARHQHMWRP